MRCSVSSEALHAWFRIAIFITVVSAALLFFQQPGTGEYVITVASLVVGLLFVAIIAVLVWRANR